MINLIIRISKRNESNRRGIIANQTLKPNKTSKAYSNIVNSPATLIDLVPLKNKKGFTLEAFL